MKNKKVDWKKVKFIARPDTWFDEGTVAIVISNEDFDLHLQEGSCIFKGIKNGSRDEEHCLLTEFDWMYEDKCINNNIPDIVELGQAEDPYVYVDLKTGTHYDVLQNKLVAQEIVVDLADEIDTKEDSFVEQKEEPVTSNNEDDFDFASENIQDLEPNKPNTDYGVNE